MKKGIFAFIGLVLGPVMSCNHGGNLKVHKDSENRIMQKEDGTLSLKLEKAGMYYDMVNPENNTADWEIVISKPGRFGVWLTSATRDTSHLRYNNSVRISLLDDLLEALPLCDKIFRISNDVQYPYFRADSYMGSVTVSESGEYHLQVISDKILAQREVLKNSAQVEDIQLLSVELTPLTR